MPTEPPVLVQVVLGLVLSWHVVGIAVMAWLAYTGAAKIAVETSLDREVADLPAEYHDRVKRILRPMLWFVLLGFGSVYWPMTIRTLREP